ncbi:hypothetical protein ECE50_018995 [Chitinophaga sp. Mgbs1]|uniref:Uncharacterized protein n=1 Tax=Chitinophaga solisilvae TaxID=1233460 RepID=A0A3S1CRV2_9BACT|nr:hypothetical protein [Chitinophaga solisilvae]
MKRITLLVSAIALITSCKNEQAPAPVSGGLDCSKAKIDSSYVAAAIRTNCTSRGCHRGGASTIPDFSSALKLKQFINNKPAVFALRVTGPQANMPPQRFPPLSQGMKDSLACWVARGMPDK